MKVVFLDVDGVIAPFSNPGIIEDEKLELIKKLVLETDSKIVLSSSWRLYHDAEPDEILNPYTYLLKRFEEFDLEIYDITPIRSAKIVTRETTTSTGVKIVNRFFDPHSIRSGQINDWLNDNKVDSFVILDDEDYNYKYFSLEDNFVKIPSSKGIEKEHIEKAINILNKGKVKKR